MNNSSVHFISIMQKCSPGKQAVIDLETIYIVNIERNKVMIKKKSPQDEQDSARMQN